MSSAVVGIDLGSYSCYLSVARKGGIETLLNEYSDRNTPSCISFNNKTRFIGNSAINQLVTNSKNTINYFVNFVGKKYRDNLLQIELPYLYYKIIENDDSFVIDISYLNKNHKFKAEQIVAMMLTKLRKLAEEQLQMPLNEIVLNVPCYYTVTERRCLLSAIYIAGLNCSTLINDLTAVGLLYQITKFQNLSQSKIIAFVDVGYTNFQASIIRFSKDRFHVLANIYDVNLGGRVFDRAIFNYLARTFKEKFNLDILDSVKACLRVLSESEKVKKRLSANSAEFTVHIECLMNDKDVDAKIDRSLFEGLIDPYITRISAHLKYLMGYYGQMKLPETLSCVELIGGSTRIPCVKAAIADCFKMEPQITLNADEAVSRGCAIKSAMMNTNCVIKRVEYFDCVPYGITLDTYIHPQIKPGFSSPVPSGISNYAQSRGAQRLESHEVVQVNQSYPLQGQVELAECNLIEIRYSDRNQVASDNKVIGHVIIKSDISNERSNKLLLDYTFDSSGLFIVNNVNLKRNSKSPRSNNQGVGMPSPIGNIESIPIHNIRQGQMSPKSNDSKVGKAKNKVPQHQSPKPQSTDYDIVGPIDHLMEYTLGFTQQHIEQLRNIELEFIKHDAEETDRLNMKNRLEESIYKYRDLLNQYKESDVKATSGQDNLDNLLGQVNQMENWLMEDGEDETKEKYKENLKKLDLLMKSVKSNVSKRQLNISNAPSALESFIQEAKVLLSKISSSQTMPTDNSIDANSKSATNPQSNNANNQTTDPSSNQYQAMKKLSDFIQQGQEIHMHIQDYLTNEPELLKFLHEFQYQLNMIDESFNQ